MPDPIINSDIRVNSTIAADQLNPVVASNGEGNFVVAWQSNGNNPGIYLQRYDSEGNAIGNEFRVNALDNATNPAVAIAADSSFAVAWESNAGLYLQRYDSSGNPLGTEFPLTTDNTAENPAIATDAQGNSIAVWNGGNGNNAGIFARRYDAATNTWESEGQVNGESGNNFTNPTIAIAPNGNAVIGWHQISQGGGGTGRDIYARRYNSDGAIGEVLRVNRTPSGNQENPTIAIAPDGQTFAIAWESGGGAAFGGIYAQRYAFPTGDRLGEEVAVESNQNARNPAIAISNDGNFATAWQNSGIIATDIFVRRYDASGNAIDTGELPPLNTYTPNLQTNPAIAPIGNGDFAIVWQSQEQDGEGSGIYAQRLNGDRDSQIQFSQPTYQLNEDGTVVGATVTLERSGGTARSATVDVRFIEGTATGTQDFVSDPKSIIFAANQTRAIVTVPIVPDRIDEENETLTLTLAEPVRAAIGTQNSATVEILDDDTAGVSATAIALNPTEAGGTAEFTVQLESEPTAPVTIAINGDAQIDRLSAPFLTFDPSNWNQPQTVTFGAVDDAIDEGTHAGAIALSATSEDAKYNDIAIAPILADIRDNDRPGVSIVVPDGSLQLTEGSNGDSYQLVLDSQPTANVTIAISTDTQSNVSNSPIIFTPENWNAAQTVTVEAVDDAIVEGNHSSQIAHTTISNDPNYNGLDLNAIDANIIDNDELPVNTAGVKLIQPIGRTDVLEGFGWDTYKIALTRQPSADVNITLTLPEGLVGMGTTPPGSAPPVNFQNQTVSFSPANWNVPQTVTVSAIDNNTRAIFRGNQAGTPTLELTHKVSSTDPAYQNLANPGLNLSVSDNDRTGETAILAQASAIGTTPIDDRLTGSPGNDIIHARSGNDLLYGQWGNDILYGQGGNDGISGGDGNDILFGGEGNDVLHGDPGDDVLYGGEGSDRLRGGDGNDILVGGEGRDRLYGDAGRDTLTGGNNRDAFAIGLGMGGATLEQADVIADFTAEDAIELLGNLPFDRLEIFQGSDAYANDTLLRDRLTGEYLAIVQNVSATTLDSLDFV